MSQFAGNVPEKCEQHIAQGPKSIAKSFSGHIYFFTSVCGTFLKKSGLAAIKHEAIMWHGWTAYFL